MNRAARSRFFVFRCLARQMSLLGFVFISCAGMIGLVALPANEAMANPRYASMVIDADTGMILHQRYADKSLHPASLTKVMTLMMVFDELRAGHLKLTDRIRISRHAAGMVPSKLDLPAGSSIRVKDAIYALVTKSANDIAAALAEHIGGSEKRFAQMMTHKARKLGMTRTVFMNASGLHHPRQVSTARDMARMGQVVVNNYRDFYHYFSTRNFKYKGRSYHNHNRLLGKYAGMDGLKTGYISASGFNLVASAERNNRRIIGVVFGGRSSYTRNAHMVKLLDRGFSKLRDVRVAYANVPVPDRKPDSVMTLAALNTLNKAVSVAPAAGPSDPVSEEKWAWLNPALSNSVFSRLIGQGDIDPAASRRIETGLLAIAAHKGEPVNTSGGHMRQAPASPYLQKAAYTKSPRRAETNTGWAVQIGAFTSRAATDKRLFATLNQLPGSLSHARPVIAPLKKGQSLLFRARLKGFSKSEAVQACRLIRDCLPVAP